MTKYLEPHMVDSLKDHVLTRLASTELVDHWKLSAPKGSAQAGLLWVHIMFTPIGIVIGGDLMGRGVIGRLDVKTYDAAWLAALPSADYLCSKFLEKVWQREAAARWCRRHANEIRQGELDPSHPITMSVESWRAWRFRHFMGLAADLEGLAVETREQFVLALRELDYETAGDEPPGTDYPLAEAGWLFAIQRKFSEEYRKMSASGTVMEAR